MRERIKKTQFRRRNFKMTTNNKSLLESKKWNKNTSFREDGAPKSIEFTKFQVFLISNSKPHLLTKITY